MDDRKHITGNDARAGTTPHIVRYVLGISLALAILAMSAIWITGAVGSHEDRDPATSAANSEQ
jgi:hypothetical protein